jgi:hypothetical protein
LDEAAAFTWLRLMPCYVKRVEQRYIRSWL